MEDHPGDLTARLPDDMIADVLRRLAPRWLAASRCVCKHWRTVIDTRSLLQTDLLPLSLHGIFIDFGWRVTSEFFSRPAPASSQISGRTDFLPDFPTKKRPDQSYTDFIVRNHCNGLVLISDYVVNPATQCWDPLPEPPPDKNNSSMFFHDCLVFDPTVSPHYEVMKVPGFLCMPKTYLNDLEFEWPPSPLVLRVFSSRLGRWKETSFIRQGNAPRAVAVGETLWTPKGLFSAYWQGSLYLYSGYFVMRISLSEGKYNIIERPVTTREDMDFSYYFSHLGRSEKGVYLASLCHHVLHVWILNESCGQLRWMLKGKYSLNPVEAFNQQVYGPWILQDSSYDMYGDHLRESTTRKPECQDKFEWNSDDDDDNDYCHTITNNVDVVDRGSDDYEVDSGISILGFHPYKEIIFLSRFEDHQRIATGLAYHLNSSKVEPLGSIYPTHGDRFDIHLRNYHRIIFCSFPYTPCWIGELPRKQ